MADTKREMERLLSDQVFEMEEDLVGETADRYLAAGYPAADAIRNGLVDGMNRAGGMYEQEEYYVSELLLCSDAMYKGLEVLEPGIPKEEIENKPKIVIGVVKGDVHDIGKNLVKIMLQSAGFSVTDLGTDVPPERFCEAVKREKAQILCLSTLLTTTMPGMEDVISELKKEGIRDRVRVMVGGGPVSQRFAERIGADGYSGDAMEAVELAKRLAAECRD